MLLGWAGPRANTETQMNGMTGASERGVCDGTAGASEQGVCDVTEQESFGPEEPASWD